MNKNIKRGIIIASMAVLISAIAIPSTAFHSNRQSVKAADLGGFTENGKFITSAYKADMLLSDRQDETDTEKAQGFDSAKKNARKLVSEVDVKPVEALTKEDKTVTDKKNTSKSNSSSNSNVSTESSKPSYTVSNNSNYLLQINNPDYNYQGHAITLTSYDRDILERLVMGEAGAEGYIGCALVAQAIRDTMVNCGYTSVEAVRTNCGYYGSLDKAPNADVKQAVAFIFDQGGAAVQHDILYFYAPQLCTSGFHESQEFVVQYNSHRFFDRW